jgi:hypothetical protein
MWTIAVVLCFMALPDTRLPLCMPASVPLKFTTQEECKVAQEEFINYFHPIAIERNLNMQFMCVSDAVRTMYNTQEIINDGHITGRSQRLSTS